jgi:ubiquinone biosynthesis monooxygenase Coq7
VILREAGVGDNWLVCCRSRFGLISGNLVELTARLANGETLGDRVLKVNHAGEHGAINIYRAQLLACWWRDAGIKNELREFLAHEKRHRSIFAAELARRDRRRCRSYWLCGIGGFVLGLVTGLCGRASIAATTVAVERVVLRHLDEQIAALTSLDTAAVAAIQSIVDDERAHHDRAAMVRKEGIFWPHVLRPMVSAATEAVIWLGMRL